MGDFLATFQVEAFALANGDWTQTHTTVTVDQPVRVNLEVPPAVHPEDQVVGRLRAVTTSREARITLTCDGKVVNLRSDDKIAAVSTEYIQTPVELEFDVKSGAYTATVEDISTGETDSVEVSVDEPGKFKSYVKELMLLRKGGSLSLATTGALTMRVLPAIDEPFDDQGRLYSTVDSAAAIALMLQLRRSGVVTGEGRVRVNGREMTIHEASQLSNPVESVEVLKGIAPIEKTRIHEEDWNSFAYAFPVKIGFRNAKS